jgi:ATP-grasp domain, R2K clade family 2
MADECRGLPDDTPVLVSEVVKIDAVARAWVLDGEVVSCALCEGASDLEGPRDFATHCARELPSQQPS